MGIDKSPVPSGVTLERLRHLPEPILDNWLLPLVNHCLTNQSFQIPLNGFSSGVWKKKKGMGSIFHPTDKLQLRPISQFEIFPKLIGLLSTAG
jgi:hypothetical protein